MEIAQPRGMDGNAGLTAEFQAPPSTNLAHITFSSRQLGLGKCWRAHARVSKIP